MQFEFSMIPAFLGSLFTAFSILFSLYIFRKRQDAISFASFRASLVDIKNNIRLLSDAMSESSMSEIGFCISSQFRSIFGDDFSKEEVINYLSDSTKRNYIVTAIHLGLMDSKAMKDTSSIIEKLNRIPFEHEFQLPLVTEIFNGCLFHIENSVGLITAIDFYTENFLSEDSLKEIIIPRLEEIDKPDILYREVAEIMYEISASAANQLSIKVFDESANIIFILVSILSRKTNRELSIYKRKDRKLLEKAQISQTEFAIDDVFQYLQLIRSEFSEKQWDEIVESKTKISQAVMEASS